MRRGYSSRQACAIVGIDVRTGKKWRNGSHAHKGNPRAVPPINREEPPSGVCRYLCEDDKIVIADRLREKASVRAIAAELGRSPSTVGREIRRNRHPVNGQYRLHAAQARADARRPRPKTAKLADNPELGAVVQGWLSLEWSPEQISRSRRRKYADRPELQVSHETIYQALYVQGRGELRRELTRALRTGRTYRKPHRRPDQRQSRFTTAMVMISDRPAEAADRAVGGHWEGDLIIGKDQKSQIATLVERTTRYVLLVHLPNGRDAETVRDALTTTMATLPAHLKRSLTRDQGAEMSLHHQFTLAADLPVYFCDPHSPWQRGTNENTNGLLRQYFPKGTDLSIHTADHLAAIAARLNGRPRKTLDWETPAERLAKLLTTAS
ncbi:IS30 family transposase [Kribbella capetownensis]|uniref:IS30 family transposase n=1 Tax=Kribbella capetownensis TaxID=1572659 RepID=UPI003B510AA1